MTTEKPSGRAKGGIAPTNQPRNDQFAIRVQGRPSPNIPGSEWGALGLRQILGLGITEAPNFVALNARRLDAATGFLMEGYASRPRVL